MTTPIKDRCHNCLDDLHKTTDRQQALYAIAVAAGATQRLPAYSAIVVRHIKTATMIGNIRYKKFFLILIFGLTNLLIVSSQIKIQDSELTSKLTKRIIARIEKQKYLMTNFIIDKKIIRLTNKLASLTTDKELISLTDSKNRILSCIAFWILVKRDNPSVPEIFDKYKDPEKIDSITYKMNEVNKNIGKFDVIFIYTDCNFFYDVYVERKYLDLINKK